MVAFGNLTEKWVITFWTECMGALPPDILSRGIYWFSLGLFLSVITLKNIYPQTVKYVILRVQNSLCLSPNERKAKLTELGG